MMKRKLLALLAVLALCATAAGPVIAKNPPGGGGMGNSNGKMPPMKAFDQTKRQAAAKANVAKGAVNNMQQLVTGAAAAPSGQNSPTNPLCPTPSTTIVDYSGTCVPNYANSPLPEVTAGTTVTTATIGDALTARQYASDDTFQTTGSGLPGLGQVLVVMPTPVATPGTLSGFSTFDQTTGGTSLASAGNQFHVYVLHPTGNPGEFTATYDSGARTVPVVTSDQAVLWDPTTGSTGTTSVTTGDYIAFYGQGIPLDTTVGADLVYYPSPAAPVLSTPFTLPDAVNFPALTGTRTYSFSADIQTTVTTTTTTGGIKKFTDPLGFPPAAVPDTTTYPGSDYYEISLGEYTQQMSSSLPPTTLRGYRQTNMGGTPYSYLGPVIVAQKDRPVRILFTNNLSLVAGGDLFIPVDTSDMGAGAGPQGGMYSSNRATLHLHGGATPWISDGTPHQWTTPAGSSEQYPKGVSVQNVPDMPAPGPGQLTFFYTNQQSARLMFYHDHALGITRLNVYAGEAAAYILHDPQEQALIDNGTLPDSPSTLPLVIQDKTFVPSDAQLRAQDPTWLSLPSTRKNPDGTAKVGDLWFPHVYMPNQNPNDPANTGADAMGRWDYAEWFWPPYAGGLTHGSIPNPLCATDPLGLSCTTMPVVPGTPNPSLVPEGFMDTPVVNGTAYPTLTVQPKAYRFQILNAANDRSWNLSLFQAGTESTAGAFVPCSGQVWSGTTLNNNGCSGEVPMVPAVQNGPGTAGYVYPDQLDGRAGGVPDSRAAGPSWVQIGTEGGVLPAPVTIAPQPVGYNYNRRDIVVLNVSNHALELGPAERADVLVDFSAYAGKTLILYNDSGAPIPAFDPRNDYYTGDPDQTSTGGAPSTLPGFGPNTRTIMQITVAAATPGPGISPNLATAIPTLYALTQPVPVVGESAYNVVPKVGNFTNAPTYTDQYMRIQDQSKTFVTGTGNSVSMNFGPKAIQELFETDYGRMNATLGSEIPNTNGVNQTTVPIGYAEPVTEVISPSQAGTLIGSAGDGTQIWKITHNGVDTHAIHFHLFDVQLINRVGWDGAIRPPDANELGWKETVRMNPLEDAIVALRPITPVLNGWGVPDSVRAIDPTIPLGTVVPILDPLTGNPTTFTNALVNYGWEYVWHCHLLGHEENDMMRPISYLGAKALPLSPNPVTASRNGSVTLHWVDGTPAPGTAATNANGEIGFRIERAPVNNGGKVGTYVQIGTALANATSYTDATAGPTATWSYRVIAWNAAGTTVSTPITVTTPPLAPSNLTAALLGPPPTIRLNWTDNANNETNYVVQQSVNGGAMATIATLGANVVTFTTPTLTPGSTYSYQVQAVNTAGPSAFAGPTTGIPVPTVPSAPVSVTVTNGANQGSSRSIVVTWTAGAGATGYVIQRSLSASFTSPTNVTVGNVLTTTITGLTRNTNYYFRVQATNPGGSSAWTNGTPFPRLTNP
jgi:FtsP/CotA-like multicopper oxidase with cupredoxin domain